MKNRLLHRIICSCMIFTLFTHNLSALTLNANSISANKIKNIELNFAIEPNEIAHIVETYINERNEPLIEYQYDQSQIESYITQQLKSKTSSLLHPDQFNTQNSYTEDLEFRYVELDSAIQ